MLGVDDLGESGCPRWSYGDGGSNTGYVSFAQNIHGVNLSYVLYQIQDMNLLHNKYTESNYHMYRVQVVKLG